MIEGEKVGSLLSSLGLDADEDTVNKIIDDFDADGIGEIAFDDLWGYYQKNGNKRKDD